MFSRVAIVSIALFIGASVHAQLGQSDEYEMSPVPDDSSVTFNQYDFISGLCGVLVSYETNITGWMFVTNNGGEFKSTSIVSDWAFQIDGRTPIQRDIPLDELAPVPVIAPGDTIVIPVGHGLSLLYLLTEENDDIQRWVGEGTITLPITEGDPVPYSGSYIATDPDFEVQFVGQADGEVTIGYLPVFDFAGLLVLLGVWHDCQAGGFMDCDVADFDGDGDVDDLDLAYLIVRWAALADECQPPPV